MRQRIQGVVFDAYGTLFDTGTGSVEATRRILQACQSQLDPGLFYREWKALHKTIIQNRTAFVCQKDVFAMGLAEMYRRYGILRNAGSDVQSMLASMYNRPVFPEVKEVLEELKTTHRIFIGSNGDTEALRQNLRYNRLEVDGYFSSEMLACYKPEEAFYKRIVEALNLEAGQLAWVGNDPAEDVAGPKRCGFFTVLLGRASSSFAIGTAPNADACISSLKELSTVFR